jgi:heme/copper-type cytochrome/quinol oxidase subunit 2
MHWPTYEGSWSTKYFGDLIFSQQQETMKQEEGTRVTALEPVMLFAIAAVVVLIVLILLYFRWRNRVSAGQAQD